MILWQLSLCFRAGYGLVSCLRLKKTDVDEDNWSLNIQRTETSYNDATGSRVFDVEETKTEAGERIVYLPEGARRTMKQIQLLNPHGEWLFCYPDGHRMRSKAIRRTLKVACEKVGIPVRPTHPVRKTYASTLIDGAVSEKLIQHQLGHKDISTTRKYNNRDRTSITDKRQEINRVINM